MSKIAEVKTEDFEKIYSKQFLCCTSFTTVTKQMAYINVSILIPKQQFSDSARIFTRYLRESFQSIDYSEHVQVYVKRLYSVWKNDIY